MKTVLLILSFYIAGSLSGQDVRQTIRGKVGDAGSRMPLLGATVYLKGTDPLIGTTTGVHGEFRIEGVPVGRYDLVVSYIGYESYVLKDIIVNSSREVITEVWLREAVIGMEEVEVRAGTSKDQAVNMMAMVSARQVSVEEARRFAGGLDDLSRVAAVGPGVGENMSGNGLVIRGNSPSGVLWQLEGIKIPNPNHFADLTVFGGGAFTALSALLIANSDFYTGAFPAEFSNALSGVFDIGIRTGNNERYGHTFQIGSLGIDLASEGPLVPGRSSSYIFNYRYSTFALLAPLLPDNAGAIRYQDLSFKMNFPLNKGSLALWGLGAADRSGQNAIKSSEEWTYPFDNNEARNKSRIGAAGITWKHLAGMKTWIRSTLAVSGNTLGWKVDKFNYDEVFYPSEDISNNTWKYTFTSLVNHKFGPLHLNRSGVILNHFAYDMHIGKASMPGAPVIDIVNEKGSSRLLQAYTQSMINIHREVVLNAGVHMQYFTLNGNATVEPRFGLKWNVRGNQTLSVGIGNHAQMEMLGLYLARQNTPAGIVYPNKELKLSRANHFVIAYDRMIHEDLHFVAEIYSQYLYHIPVIPDSSWSLINVRQDFYMNEAMLNRGKGWNKGIELTLERFLGKGLYYMVSASFFDSRYTGGDGIIRSTRYDKGYILNLLAGKEWKTGRAKNNMIGINGRFKLQGGDRYSPVNFKATQEAGDIVYDEREAFSEEWPATAHLHLTLNYTRNSKKYSGIWSVQLVNLLGASEYYGHKYNLRGQAVEVDKEVMFLPNISYKIEF